MAVIGLYWFGWFLAFAALGPRLYRDNGAEESLFIALLAATLAVFWPVLLIVFLARLLLTRRGAVRTR